MNRLLMNENTPEDIADHLLQDDALWNRVVQAIREAEARGEKRGAERMREAIVAMFDDERCIDHESGGLCVSGRVLALKLD